MVSIDECFERLIDESYIVVDSYSVGEVLKGLEEIKEVLEGFLSGAVKKSYEMSMEEMEEFINSISEWMEFANGQIAILKMKDDDEHFIVATKVFVGGEWKSVYYKFHVNTLKFLTKW